MKSITILQPWATLIAIGEKKFETRSWRTHYRGPVAIHAGKKVDRDACQETEISEALARHGYTADNLPTGAVVAIVQLQGCYRIYNTIDNGVHIVRCPDDQYDFDKVEFIHHQERSFGWYDSGRYAWELTIISRLPEPIPAKGQQGLWNWERE